MTEEALAASDGGPQRTGIEPLDAVLAQVADLDERPLTEHAAVFEAAHVELRRPLDDPPADLSAPEHTD